MFAVIASIDSSIKATHRNCVATGVELKIQNADIDRMCGKRNDK